MSSSHTCHSYNLLIHVIITCSIAVLKLFHRHVYPLPPPPPPPTHLIVPTMSAQQLTWLSLLCQPNSSPDCPYYVSTTAHLIVPTMSAQQLRTLSPHHHSEDLSADSYAKGKEEIFTQNTGLTNNADKLSPKIQISASIIQCWQTFTQNIDLSISADRFSPKIQISVSILTNFHPKYQFQHHCWQTFTQNIDLCQCWQTFTQNTDLSVNTDKLLPKI